MNIVLCLYTTHSSYIAAKTVATAKKYESLAVIVQSAQLYNCCPHMVSAACF